MVVVLLPSGLSLLTVALILLTAHVVTLGTADAHLLVFSPICPPAVLLQNFSSALHSVPGSLFSPDPITSHLSWLNLVFLVSIVECRGSGLFQTLLLSLQSPQLGWPVNAISAFCVPTSISWMGFPVWAGSLGHPVVARSISCIPALLWHVIPCHRHTMCLQ